ncbi:bifunctional methylenetetrahydrofolate dehydrogenase/methenyltetrahydrofolate cyclohydrolase FolD [bacterium]|nr:bifunctional methylenetetrahydrofolate dehydrogenase/methenyltetrahydrofolate cyclohydrolase FolD [bacterium]
MTASILDGKHVSAQIRAKIKHEVTTRVLSGLRPPGLAVILVGENPASSIYVNSKQKACLDVGFHSSIYRLASNTTQNDLVALIDELNVSDVIDGILVQLPLPVQINPAVIIEKISPYKDVDGFHPYNLGRLAQGNPTLRPCTPYGIIKLLEHYQLPLLGKHAVVIGSSNIVGRPMGLEFLLAKSTVTICHRATQGLEKHVRMADIIVAATGTLDVIDIQWLNSNQIVIDVGMHRLPNGSLRGDVDFQTAKNKVAWITPVPYGIGPMTIAMLLQNTWNAALSIS